MTAGTGAGAAATSPPTAPTAAADVPDINLEPTIYCPLEDCLGACDTDGTSWWCTHCPAIWDENGQHGEADPDLYGQTT